MTRLLTQHVEKPTDFQAATVGTAIAAALLLTTGCAWLDRRPAEEVVKERAQERWSALVRQDLEAAYRFHSPGSKSVIPFADFKGAIKPGVWKAAAVNKAECTADRCEVHVAIDVEAKGMRTKYPLRETWIKEGSQWWYLHR